MTAHGSPAVSGQAPSPTGTKSIATPMRGFGVPFKINADDSSYIEVQLFVSRDLGKTWQFHARQATDSSEFPFQAERDGEYWFALRTLNRDRKLVPEGQIQPELKIVVDSVRPTLKFNTSTDAAGRVICSWDARDPNLNLNSLRIFYRENGATDPNVGWEQVPIRSSLNSQPGILRDEIAWWPKNSGQALQVKIEVADNAGNQASEMRAVDVPAVAWRNKSSSTANVQSIFFLSL